jgi:radical SAM C-methyltransferase
MSRKRVVKLVQKAVWDIEATGLESMPLAISYLKAFAENDFTLKRELDLEICNFGGSATSIDTLKAIATGNMSDMVCFSVYGWNLSFFGKVAETYRQFNPEGWIVLGGPHVTDQAERIFKTYPEMDIIVNYEGEITFYEILRSYLGGKTKNDLFHIDGVSFKGDDGRIVSTPKRERIRNLDKIPSPFLTGAMPLTKENGDFKYDVALVETSRGCPYKCAYCFWGGAIGQRISYFSIERLKEEIELFGRLKVREICLCDANFGMTEHDVEFVEALIKAKEKYGYPRRIVTSWAKIKRKPFYRILERMNETGVGTSFSLSLQSLHPPVLEIMERTNPDLENCKKFSDITSDNKLELYGELMWGLPGETYESFIQGYNKLSEDVPRIAVYPLLLLPNTKYYLMRDELGIRTLKAGNDDFEYVLAHNTMDFIDNCEMHKFIFWARILFEYPFFRYIMHPLRIVANISQSDIIFSLDRWIDKSDNRASSALRNYRDKVADTLDAYAIEKALYYIYQELEFALCIEAWWEEEILPLVPDIYDDFFVELVKYDLLTRPIFGSNAEQRKTRRDRGILDGIATVVLENEEYYVKEDNPMLFDIPECTSCIIKDSQCSFEPSPRLETLYYKVGFSDFISNHEFYHEFCGKTKQQIIEEKVHCRP